MIDRIIVENFKSLRKVDVSLGRANLLIGENGSGKSNFLEVFRVVRGLSRGLTVAEILDGKPPSENSSGWTGIRGGRAAACFGCDYTKGEVMIDIRGTSEPPESEKWEYFVKFAPEAGHLVRECLKLGSRVLFDSDPDLLGSQLVSNPNGAGDEIVISDIGSGSILAQVKRDLRSLTLAQTFQFISKEGNECKVQPECVFLGARQAINVTNMLANILLCDPSPTVLRQYSKLKFVRSIGDRGEHFAAVVESICLDAEAKDSLLWWMQQLLSERVEDIGTMCGRADEAIFKIREQGRDLPATVLSDGTLRFAAILAAFFQPDIPSIMTLDSIETAIHPNRIRLLYLLWWCESEYHRIQSISTTQSPVMLEWMRENDLATTFVCKKDRDTGETKIVPLPDVPHFMDIFRRGARTSDALVDSWFECEL